MTMITPSAPSATLSCSQRELEREPVVPSVTSTPDCAPRVDDAAGDLQRVGADEIAEDGQHLPRLGHRGLPRPDVAVPGQQVLDPCPGRGGDIAPPVDDLRNRRERDLSLGGDGGQQTILGVALRLRIGCHCDG
jgi:hypothetical protein